MGSFVSMMCRGALVAVATCAVSSLAAPAAFALCAEASEASHFDQATIVFEGVAQPGDTVDGPLLSPATFRVERYLKGNGPAELQVTTGTSDAGDGRYMMVSTGIQPSAGERWRVFATGPADEVLTTSACHGSRRIAQAAAVPDAADPGSALNDDPGVVRSDDPSPLIPLLLTVIVLAAVMSMLLVRRSTDGPLAEDSR